MLFLCYFLLLKHRIKRQGGKMKGFDLEKRRHFMNKTTKLGLINAG